MEYLKQLDIDWWKEKLSELRNLIKEYGSDLEEGTRDGMLSYKDSKGGG